ncbi:hypothetical protein S7711_04442 [Stachybotrys chartarum IBT 7711]|uniref:Uncharacterized protein n=1 Tax=Stachybotrys chartarum (strain CBS 109288 / IBT 7711) TaxID=1280523 RepID=A0A084B5N7_STACB|nr:hypothetical protein S7711_04442 [Stachybotrys chartarum IBT 7711]KFA53338.1 hypothetical protein S40293_06677 [Stachybotrys chartarum IBT 40293]KFA73398.1 hypothetical protein S40288_04195 [Stachybotrys chartarum IBT 40288]
MPLFGSRREPEPVYEPEPVRQPEPRRGFFGSRHEEPAPPPEPVRQPEGRRHGLFGSRRDPSPTGRSSTSSMSSRSSGTYHTTSADPHHNANGTRRSGSLLSRSFGHGNSRNSDMDPSILEARERVMGAESAEREADRALDSARLRVREAREHVKRLEDEAKEEARRAKIKQYHAKEVSKRGKNLGRYGE